MSTPSVVTSVAGELVGAEYSNAEWDAIQDAVSAFVEEAHVNANQSRKIFNVLTIGEHHGERAWALSSVAAMASEIFQAIPRDPETDFKADGSEKPLSASHPIMKKFRSMLEQVSRHPAYFVTKECTNADGSLRRDDDGNALTVKEPIFGYRTSQSDGGVTTMPTTVTVKYQWVDEKDKSQGKRWVASLNEISKQRGANTPEGKAAKAKADREKVETMATTLGFSSRCKLALSILESIAKDDTGTDTAKDKFFELVETKARKLRNMYGPLGLPTADQIAQAHDAEFDPWWAEQSKEGISNAARREIEKQRQRFDLNACRDDNGKIGVQAVRDVLKAA